MVFIRAEFKGTSTLLCIRSFMVFPFYSMNVAITFNAIEIIRKSISAIVDVPPFFSRYSLALKFSSVFAIASSTALILRFIYHLLAKHPVTVGTRKKYKMLRSEWVELLITPRRSRVSAIITRIKNAKIIRKKGLYIFRKNSQALLKKNA